MTIAHCIAMVPPFVLICAGGGRGAGGRQLLVGQTNGITGAAQR